MAFYRLTDGKVVEERAQLDMLGLLQQLGAAPSAQERRHPLHNPGPGTTAGAGPRETMRRP